MESRLLDVLSERVLIYDGATGTQFQAAGLSADDFVLDPSKFDGQLKATAQRLNGLSLDGCNELLVATRPDIVEAVHSAYFEAGSDLAETNTFGTTSVVLGEYDVPELVYDLSVLGAQIARRAADKYSTPDKPRFVVGGLGPGTKLVSLGQVTWDDLEKTYCEAYTGLIVGGSDALLVETTQDLLMVKSAIVAANRAMAETGKRLPLFVQVTMEQTGTMLLGSEIGAALNMVESFPSVTAFGMNCATGPVEMAQHVRFLGQNSTRPIAVQPNAGLPIMEKGQAVYKLTPEELVHHHTNFIEQHGVAMVGGCCGTTPAHIKAVSEALSGHKHTAPAHWIKKRILYSGFNFENDSPEKMEGKALVGCSSLYQFQPYKQDNSILIVGEKTNANGSKAFREMLAAENWEGLTELARDLEAEGSHVLDVCTAYVGRNEARDMEILLGYYNRHITVPIMVDSTEVPVIEAALKKLGGKPIVNSINFEDGEERTQKVLALCRKYGAGIVALTIDEDGMAKSAEKKLEIARRLIDRTRAVGVADQDVFIDCLTFTLGSGDEEFRASAIATIDAIAGLKQEFPLVNTILGVSNVSFGLRPAARQILNSVFLHFAEEAGLTSAIVHFSKIVPESKIDPEVWKITSDLVYDRREFATV
ncbi:MAG: methionine synthase [Armatimonadetes bacterium]|nr:methionine synthase [Armatimonadota bacterium]MBS1725559.1 homocysteine S-methyltransferase family protein [Armatimonadota bacterium]